MAAGLGFKDFTTGEVLTAADVDGYLMQGVWVFASAAARDAAVTSPQEGNFAYLKDTNVTTYYTGSAWSNLDTTGMTNPMTTTGDIVYSSSGSTPARLGIGSTGQVLTVSGGIPSWATAGASPNYQLINAGGTALTGATTITVSGISGKNELFILVDGASSANAGSNISLRLNADSGTNYGYANVQRLSSTSADSDGNSLNQSRFTVSTLTDSDNTSTTIAYIHIFGCNSAGFKIAHINSYAAGTNSRALASMGAYEGTSTISSISLLSSTGNFDAGTLYVYGA